MNIRLNQLFNILKIVLLLVIIGVLASYWFFVSSQENKVLDNNVRKNVYGENVHLKEGWTHFKRTKEKNNDLVVLIHGGGVTGIHVWEETMKAINKANYNYLAYDLYGRGYSDRPKVAYTPDLMLHQLEQLLDTLHVERKFDIVALSLGAMVAVDFANKYPERVKKIVFIDPMLQGTYRPNFLLKIPLLSDYIMTAYWYPRAVENQRKEFANMLLFEEYATKLRYFMDFKGYKYVNYSTWMNTLQHNYMPAFKKLGEKNIDLLLVYGNRDPYFPHHSFELFLEAVPQIDYFEVDQTGHMPHYEKPKIVNKEIINFIKSDKIE